MPKNSDDFEKPTTPWMRKVQRFIAMGQKARALQIIERVIEYDMPLFRNDPVVQEDRRFAWRRVSGTMSQVDLQLHYNW